MEAAAVAAVEALLLMVTVKTYLFFFLILPFTFFGSYCYFIPPSNWQIIDPKLLSEYVEMGFHDTEGTTELFTPSVNLAKEPTKNSLARCVKDAKKEHTKDRRVTWRDLGPFSTKAGPAHLTEIITTNRFGKIRMWQLIFVKNQTAYYLTGAASEKTFPQMRNTFVKTFQSLSYTEDLLQEITDPTTREKLKDAYVSVLDEKVGSKPWKKFEKLFTKQSDHLGPYWQYLFLKNYRNNLKTPQ